MFSALSLKIPRLSISFLPFTGLAKLLLIRAFFLFFSLSKMCKPQKARDLGNGEFLGRNLKSDRLPAWREIRLGMQLVPAVLYPTIALAGNNELDVYYLHNVKSTSPLSRGNGLGMEAAHPDDSRRSPRVDVVSFNFEPLDLTKHPQNSPGDKHRGHCCSTCLIQQLPEVEDSSGLADANSGSSITLLTQFSDNFKGVRSILRVLVVDAAQGAQPITPNATTIPIRYGANAKPKRARNGVGPKLDVGQHVERLQWDRPAFTSSFNGDVIPTPRSFRVPFGTMIKK
ncbi:hypothetical protein C8R43DRAFT_1103719 [Mycena crocata]|nr:hypothetical protein C8R43DRAFT_1103719 [Mycena crocata]